MAVAGLQTKIKFIKYISYIFIRNNYSKRMTSSFRLSEDKKLYFRKMVHVPDAIRQGVPGKRKSGKKFQD